MGTFLRKLWHNHFAKKDDSHKRQAEAPEVPRGFGMKMEVPVETPSHAPVVAQTYGDGGVQGLKWYAEKLRVDDDGDVAQEFLSEVVSGDEKAESAGRTPKLETVAQTQPVVPKGPVCLQNGNVHQYVESPSGHSWA